MLAQAHPEAMIFDLDGTIVDTETPEFEAIRAVWAEHGAQFTVAQFEHCVGTAVGIGGWVDDLSDVVGYEIDAAAAHAQARRVHHDLVAVLEPRPGIVVLVEQAAAAGIPLAIASNSPRPWVVARLAGLGLADHFGVLVSVDDASHPKPHPAPFVEACAALGAEPSLSIAFEDSVTGVTAALGAGLYTVACPGPLTRNHDLSGAHLVIESHVDVSVETLARALGR